MDKKVLSPTWPLRYSSADYTLRTKARENILHTNLGKKEAQAKNISDQITDDLIKANFFQGMAMRWSHLERRSRLK